MRLDNPTGTLLPYPTQPMAISAGKHQEEIINALSFEGTLQTLNPVNRLSKPEATEVLEDLRPWVV